MLDLQFLTATCSKIYNQLNNSNSHSLCFHYFQLNAIVRPIFTELPSLNEEELHRDTIKITHSLVSCCPTSVSLSTICQICLFLIPAIHLCAQSLHLPWRIPEGLKKALKPIISSTLKSGLQLISKVYIRRSKAFVITKRLTKGWL